MKPIFMQISRFLPAGALAAVCIIPSVASAAPILAVPFTSQAPMGNWADPWQEYCEEASVVMAAHFLWRLPIPPAIADFEMGLIRRFEIAAFGHWRDTSIEETADILRRLYGFSNVSTVLIVTSDDIKRELAAGRVVIAPTAGGLLKNPYFTLPGPAYHMLVVKGFDDATKEFIVNDPGTRRGEGLRYAEDVLFNAIHDLASEDIVQGEKRIIVVGR